MVQILMDHQRLMFVHSVMHKQALECMSVLKYINH